MSKITIYQIFTRLFGNTNSACIPHASKEKNGIGKFNDINEKALAQIKKLGITHIWYTGIIEHAIIDGYPQHNIPDHNPLIVKGRAGSPYAICDYYDVNPDLAVDVKNRMQEFEKLVERTHQQDLKVIIDFVPNHLARQYISDQKPKGIKDFGEDDDQTKSFDNQNNFYYLPDKVLVLPEELIQKTNENYPFTAYKEIPAKATGNDKFDHVIHINDWYETVKLNYGVNYQTGESDFDPIPDTWLKMLDILLFWSSKKVDAFRCDMAEMVPVEFWNWVIPKVKEQYPEIIFIAEIYNPNQYSEYIEYGSFDYLYDKVGLYDSLKNIIQGHSTVNEITKCWQQLNGNDPKMLRFLENHDEQRIASRFFADDPWKAIPGIVVSIFMNTGPFMIYFGQEVGEPANGESGFSGDDGRTTIFDYWNVPEHQKWMNNGKFDGGMLSPKQKDLRETYQFLLNFALKNEAIYAGKFYDLMWCNQQNIGMDTGKIYTFIRYTKNQRILILANFSVYEMNLKIKIPEHALLEIDPKLSEELQFKSQVSELSMQFSKEKLKNGGMHLNISAYGFELLAF